MIPDVGILAMISSQGSCMLLSTGKTIDFAPNNITELLQETVCGFESSSSRVDCNVTAWNSAGQGPPSHAYTHTPAKGEELYGKHMMSACFCQPVGSISALDLQFLMLPAWIGELL